LNRDYAQYGSADIAGFCQPGGWGFAGAAAVDAARVRGARDDSRPAAAADVSGFGGLSGDLCRRAATGAADCA